MTLNQVYKYFGSVRAVFKHLDIARANWYYWEEKNGIPYDRQLELEKISKGKLKAKWNHSTEAHSLQEKRRNRKH